MTYRVLVVDDDPSLARLATTILTHDGHAVDAVHSTAEALTYLAQQQVDVVVSDLGLGDSLNGWALAGRVKDQWPTTAFVLLSGWGDAIDVEAARAVGVAAVVAKPYRVATLRQALRSL